jgi:hypothetical protein
MKMTMDRERRVALTAVAVWTGLGYLFGPDHIYSSPTLSVVRSLHVPFPLWGVVYLLLAILLWVRPKVGSLFGIGLYTFWALCLAATIPTGQIAGWSGPAWAALIAVTHHLALRWHKDPDNVH